MIIWKDSNAMYLHGEYGYLGKYKIFHIQWNGCRSRDSKEKDYKLYCYLPGIKNDLGDYEDDEAKLKAKSVLDYWLSNTGLTYSPDELLGEG